MPSFEYEEKHYAEGYTAVCGLDEAGRGPLCGPVVAAAVILPHGLEIEGLNDSKKLTPKKRDSIFDVIKNNTINEKNENIEKNEVIVLFCLFITLILLSSRTIFIVSFSFFSVGLFSSTLELLALTCTIKTLLLIIPIGVFSFTTYPISIALIKSSR